MASMKAGIELIRLRTSAIFNMPSCFSTRLASRMNWGQLVPISERQNIARWTEFCSKGTLAISQAITWSLTATKSNECTRLETDWAILASPHPKSTITKDDGNRRMHAMKSSTGFCGHFFTCPAVSHHLYDDISRIKPEFGTHRDRYGNYWGLSGTVSGCSHSVPYTRPH